MASDRGPPYCSAAPGSAVCGLLVHCSLELLEVFLYPVHIGHRGGCQVVRVFCLHWLGIPAGLSYAPSAARFPMSADLQGECYGAFPPYH